MSSESVLGIIPARGGSKGVRRKNIRMVGGRPLIAYTIDAARQSTHLTTCVVSTDDEEIAEVAGSLGCEVVMRPDALAEDNTPMAPVLSHAIEETERKGIGVDHGVILQPTVPLRTGEDIDRTLDILIDGGADSVVSVVLVSDHHPSRMYRLEDRRLVPYAPEPEGSLRQDLPDVYHRNGAVYAFRRSLIADTGGFIGPDNRPYVMPSERSINIDEEYDLLLADLLITHQQSLT